MVDTHASAIGSGATVLTMATPVAVKKGDLVAGTGVAAGTTVDEDSAGGSHVTVKLDTPTSGNMGASNAITFTSVPICRSRFKADSETGAVTLPSISGEAGYNCINRG